jgi:hypothetical protein
MYTVIHPLVDDSLTEILCQSMIKYKAVDTLNPVVILKPVRLPDRDRRGFVAKFDTRHGLFARGMKMRETYHVSVSAPSDRP